MKLNIRAFAFAVGAVVAASFARSDASAYAMTMRVIRSAVWLLVVLALLGFSQQIAWRAEAQSDAHEQHHPGMKASKPKSPPPSAGPAPGVMGGKMEGGASDVGKMMEWMGVPMPKELYPSLMHLLDGEIERLGQERMRWEESTK